MALLYGEEYQLRDEDIRSISRDTLLDNSTAVRIQLKHDAPYIYLSKDELILMLALIDEV